MDIQEMPKNLVNIKDGKTYIDSQGNERLNRSIKISELGINQRIILKVLFPELKFSVGNFEGRNFNSYSGLFEYKPFNHNIQSIPRVWVNFSEKVGEQYNKLFVMEGDYISITKVKIENYKYPLYQIDKCDEYGNLFQKIVPTQISLKEQIMPPNNNNPSSVTPEEKGVMRLIRDKEFQTKAILVEEQWVYLVKEKLGVSDSRAKWLYQFRDSDLEFK